MNTKEIIDGLVNKDEETLAYAMSFYEKEFFRVCKSIIPFPANETVISDCIMDTWSYIWLNIEHYPKHTYSFEQWIMMILKCRAINGLNQTKRRSENKTAAEATVILHDAAEVYMNREDYAALVSKIHALPPPRNIVMTLRFLDGLSPGEIARRLNMPRLKIKYLLSDAKRLLKKKLRQE